MSTWLIFDVNNLCFRAFYGMGNNLSSPLGDATGVYYNFLGTVLHLQGEFRTERCVFCFDSKSSKRKKVTKAYKQNREKTPQELEKLWDLFAQIRGLRQKYLPMMGFQNVFIQPGYEADDVCAAVCQDLSTRKDEYAVVVSSDSDLLQLITNRTHVYDPKKRLLWTKKLFKKMYGIRPSEWATVKALAGCQSDGVKGIRGVGEKTAIKFLNQTLSTTSKAFVDITSRDGLQIRKENLPLVKLPYEGVNQFPLREDGEIDWRDALQELGIKTLKPKKMSPESGLAQ